MLVTAQLSLGLAACITSKTPNSRAYQRPPRNCKIEKFIVVSVLYDLPLSCPRGSAGLCQPSALHLIALRCMTFDRHTLINMFVYVEWHMQITSEQHG